VLKGLQLFLWLPEAWYNKSCIHSLADYHKRCIRIVISMSVYFSVCLSARISLELHVRSLPNIWCMLPTVVAQYSSSEGG